MNQAEPYIISRQPSLYTLFQAARLYVSDQERRLKEISITPLTPLGEYLTLKCGTESRGSNPCATINLQDATPQQGSNYPQWVDKAFEHFTDQFKAFEHFTDQFGVLKIYGWDLQIANPKLSKVTPFLFFLGMLQESGQEPEIIKEIASDQNYHPFLDDLLKPTLEILNIQYQNPRAGEYNFSIAPTRVSPEQGKELYRLARSQNAEISIHVMHNLSRQGLIEFEVSESLSLAEGRKAKMDYTFNYSGNTDRDRFITGNVEQFLADNNIVKIPEVAQWNVEWQTSPASRRS